MPKTVINRFPREQLYSVPDLKLRGWTKTAIERFMSKHDDERDNPHYSRAGAPMKFYLRTRVHRIETTKKFLTWKQGSGSRRAAAHAGVATREHNMQALMGKVEITIVRGKTTEQIRQLAVQTHGGNYQGDPGEFVWNNRTAINCIRHNLTNYEHHWRQINRGDTGKLAYQVLRDRVDDLIQEAYPQFFLDSEQSVPPTNEDLMRRFNIPPERFSEWMMKLSQTTEEGDHV